MRRNVDVKFEHAFEKAYHDYIEGNWSSAGEKLAKLRRHKPNDGPTKILHEFVNVEHNRLTPAGWKGVRELTRKT